MKYSPVNCLGVLLAVSGEKTGDEDKDAETKHVVEQKGENAHPDCNTTTISEMKTNAPDRTRTCDLRIRR